jgi:uncharacterized protein (TIGR03435 family)
MNTGGIGVVLLFNTLFIVAQSQFEVASIKPSRAGSLDREGNRREQVDTSPNSLTMGNVSLKSCVRWAYGVQASQVTGPVWLETERFDIAAKAAGPVSEEQLRLMLRSLLADRFKLTLHRDSKVMSSYELTLAKNGPKLQKSEAEGKSSHRGNGMKETFEKTSMPELAEQLAAIVRSPVTDRTGLRDRFEFAMDFSGFFVPGATLDDLPAYVNGAIQAQLGLKLESRKAPVEILVIDHAERVPSEN